MDLKDIQSALHDLRPRYFEFLADWLEAMIGVLRSWETRLPQMKKAIEMKQQAKDEDFGPLIETTLCEIKLLEGGYCCSGPEVDGTTADDHGCHRCYQKV